MITELAIASFLTVISFWQKAPLLYVLSGLGFMLIGWINYATLGLYFSILLVLAGLFIFIKGFVQP